jgi:hypothetical protein
MSFGLIELQKLHATGGQVLEEYQRLVGEADRSLHGSPAQRELAAFQQDWIAHGPDSMIDRVRSLYVARAEAAGTAARSAA